MHKNEKWDSRLALRRFYFVWIVCDSRFDIFLFSNRRKCVAFERRQLVGRAEGRRRESFFLASLSSNNFFLSLLFFSLFFFFYTAHHVAIVCVLNAGRDCRSAAANDGRYKEKERERERWKSGKETEQRKTEREREREQRTGERVDAARLSVDAVGRTDSLENPAGQHNTTTTPMNGATN